MTARSRAAMSRMTCAWEMKIVSESGRYWLEGALLRVGGSQILHEAAAHALLVVGDELGGEAALFRGEADDLLIVEGDAQLFGQRLADFTAAAAVFAADGDD